MKKDPQKIIKILELKNRDLQKKAAKKAKIRHIQGYKEVA
jgi:hypothetical protein